MGAYDAIFGDETKKPTATTNVPNAITNELLDSLRIVEGGKEQFPINKQTKAMGPYQFMPDTVQMLHKKGYKFNAFDEQESREASKKYLTELLDQNKGDLRKALAQYGGFVKTDPTNYVNKVLGNVKQKQPVTSINQIEIQPEVDILGQFFSSKENPKPPARMSAESVPTAQNIQPTKQDYSKQVIPSMGEKLVGVGEAALKGASSFVAPIVGGAAGVISNIVGGDLGTQQGIQNAEKVAGDVSGALTYEPRTEAGKAFAGNVGNKIQGVLEATKMPPMGPIEVISQLPATSGMKNQIIAVIKNPILEKTAIAKPLAIAERIEPTTGKPKLTAEQYKQRLQQEFYGKLNQQLSGENQAQMPGVGAAKTNAEAAYQAELAAAHPEVKQQFANIPPNQQNLKALQTHNKFAKFDMTPTEGEALQDTALMSQEYNERAKDPAMMGRLEERDPKLIQGFEKIKDIVAPDVYESDITKLHNSALEKLKANDEIRNTAISEAYKELTDANGGQFPLDGQAFANKAINQLHHELIFEATPSVLKKALEKFASGDPMTFENFERLRTITATEMRKGGTEAHTAAVIRDALENMPLSEEAKVLKPLADKARQLVKERKKLIENNPAYKAAISDTRTADEIASGVSHPAAKIFDKYYNAKTPETNIQRLKQELGENSPEFQGLNSAIIENIKRQSGIVNNKGSVSQAALNKQIHTIYGPNLDLMFGKENAQYLKDLGDVARMSEHVKGKHYVNVSNTEVVAEQNRLKEAGKAVAGTAAEMAIAAKTGGAYPILKKSFEYIKEQKAAKQAAEAERAAQKALEQRRAERLSRTAGTSKLSDIGK